MDEGGGYEFDHDSWRWKKTSMYACAYCCEGLLKAQLREIKRTDGQPWYRDGDGRRQRWFLLCRQPTRYYSKPAGDPFSFLQHGFDKRKLNAAKDHEEKSPLGNAVSHIMNLALGQFVDDNDERRPDQVSCTLTGADACEPFEYFPSMLADPPGTSPCRLCSHSEWVTSLLPSREVERLAHVYPYQRATLLGITSNHEGESSPTDGEDDIHDLEFCVVSTSDREDHSRVRRARLLLTVSLGTFAGSLKTRFKGTADYISQIRSWMSDCQTAHETCRVKQHGEASEAAALPTRLLELRTTTSVPQVRLVEASTLLGRKIEYATLSHCWGKSGPPVRLTQKNYDSLRHAVRFEHLPVTFRDAIKMALSLDIGYLWIDALCIVQDSDGGKDWSLEAPRMASIYSNCILNMAATYAEDSYGGLLGQQQRDHDMHDIAIHLPWDAVNQKQRLWSLEPASDVVWQFERYVSKRAALSQRAWVYQERLLAPRTVSFARDQLWWSCREGNRAECKQCGSSRLSKINLRHRSWVGLAAEYSQMRLTKPTDRLIAFAGVAEEYARFRELEYKPDDYIAGLWRQDILNQLLWYRSGPEVAASHDYIAPSWSWASLNGPHEHPALKRKSCDVMHPALKFRDAQLRFTSDSRFGQIEDGGLRLEGCLHPLIFDVGESVLTLGNERYWRSRHSDEIWDSEDKCKMGNRSGKRLWISFDYPQRSGGRPSRKKVRSRVRKTTIYFIPFSWEYEFHRLEGVAKRLFTPADWQEGYYQDPLMHGLLVERLKRKGDDVFRRAGYLRMMPLMDHMVTPPTVWVNGVDLPELRHLAVENGAYEIRIV